VLLDGLPPFLAKTEDIGGRREDLVSGCARPGGGGGAWPINGTHEVAAGPCPGCSVGAGPKYMITGPGNAGYTLLNHSSTSRFVRNSP
jgi:hypothetical protein